MNKNMTNAVLENMRSRRSVRAYLPEQIKDEELQAVLEAGIYAPTGMGTQEPWIVAVQDAELRARITKMNFECFDDGMRARMAERGTDDPFYGAPTIILVFADPKYVNTAVEDGSLILGNMMNAAHAVGLGSCWINREKQMFSKPEGQALLKELGLPEGLIGVGALSLGYPKGEPKPAKPRKENYYRIIK